MKVSLPVVRVTVLEDRASVRRAGPLELPLGHRRVRIEGLAPVLVDKTLSVVGEGVQVGDVTIRRQQIHRTAEVDSAETSCHQTTSSGRPPTGKSVAVCGTHLARHLNQPSIVLAGL